MLVSSSLLRGYQVQRIVSLKRYFPTDSCIFLHSTVPRFGELLRLPCFSVFTGEFYAGVFCSQVFISWFEMLKAEHGLVPTCCSKEAERLMALGPLQLFKRVMTALSFLSAENGGISAIAVQQQKGHSCTV